MQPIDGLPDDHGADADEAQAVEQIRGALESTRHAGANDIGQEQTDQGQFVGEIVHGIGKEAQAAGAKASRSFAEEDGGVQSYCRGQRLSDVRHAIPLRAIRPCGLPLAQSLRQRNRSAVTLRRLHVLDPRLLQWLEQADSTEVLAVDLQGPPSLGRQMEPPFAVRRGLRISLGLSQLGGDAIDATLDLAERSADDP